MIHLRTLARDGGGRSRRRDGERPEESQQEGAPAPTDGADAAPARWRPRRGAARAGHAGARAATTARVTVAVMAVVMGRRRRSRGRRGGRAGDGGHRRRRACGGRPGTRDVARRAVRALALPRAPRCRVARRSSRPRARAGRRSVDGARAGARRRGPHGLARGLARACCSGAKTPASTTSCCATCAPRPTRAAAATPTGSSATPPAMPTISRATATRRVRPPRSRAR